MGVEAIFEAGQLSAFDIDKVFNVVAQIIESLLHLLIGNVLWWLQAQDSLASMVESALKLEDLRGGLFLFGRAGCGIRFLLLQLFFQFLNLVFERVDFCLLRICSRRRGLFNNWPAVSTWLLLSISILHS